MKRFPELVFAFMILIVCLWPSTCDHLRERSSPRRIPVCAGSLGVSALISVVVSGLFIASPIQSFVSPVSGINSKLRRFHSLHFTVHTGRLSEIVGRLRVLGGSSGPPVPINSQPRVLPSRTPVGLPIFQDPNDRQFAQKSPLRPLYHRISRRAGQNGSSLEATFRTNAPAPRNHP